MNQCILIDHYLSHFCRTYAIEDLMVQSSSYHHFCFTFRQLTVRDFMNAVVPTTPDSGKVIPPITCQLESTLGSVIHSLASKSVHRIYVVAGEGAEVVGVITLRDVISCFIFEPPNHLDNYFGFSVKDLLNQ